MKEDIFSPKKGFAQKLEYFWENDSKIIFDPIIMGILNVTPDSFSDGGQYFSVQAAVQHAQRLMAEGADIIDIGGESTRPQAAPVSAEEELERILPVVRILRDKNIPVSVDTSQAEVMNAVIPLGVELINDVRSFHLPGALASIQKSNHAICIMHMRGTPVDMQNAPTYKNVVAEVCESLAKRVAELCHAGIDAKRIILDPGFGFGKTVQHNYELLANLKKVALNRFPVLAGLSRKSMLTAITAQREPKERVAASIAAAFMAVDRGAAILRVHDVAATVDALAIRRATLKAEFK